MNNKRKNDIATQRRREFIFYVVSAILITSFMWVVQC